MHAERSNSMKVTYWSVVIWLCLLIFLRTSEAQQTGSINALLQLTNDLFSNYSKYVRPVYNLSDAVTVETSLFLLSVLDLDEVAGTITLSAGITMYWIDYRLKWTPSDYGGITEFVWNSSVIWKPRVFLITSASQLEEFGSDMFDVRITYTGMVIFSPGKMATSTCTVDMSNFPRDSQTCSLLLLPWNYEISEVMLTYTRTDFVMTYYTPNGEWDITKTSVSTYTGFGTPSNILDCKMYMSRKSGYFTISMIVPVFLLCFLNPLVFLIPASSGERISYTITMFLSLAVYMTLIGDNMPKVSEPMAGISFFLLIAMCYSCLLIVLTIFTLRCEAAADINVFPSCLVKLVQCFKRERRGNKIEDKDKCNNDMMNAAIFGSKEVESLDSRPVENAVLKSDVVTFIDRSMLTITILIMLVTSTWYLLCYY